MKKTKLSTLVACALSLVLLLCFALALLPQPKQTARAAHDPANDEISVVYISQNEITAVTESFLDEHVDNLEMYLLYDSFDVYAFWDILQQTAGRDYTLVVLDLQTYLYDNLTSMIEDVGIDFNKTMLICATDEATLDKLISEVPPSQNGYAAIINVSDFRSSKLEVRLEQNLKDIAERYFGQTVNIVFDYEFYDFYYLLRNEYFMNLLKEKLEMYNIYDYHLYFQIDPENPEFLDVDQGFVIGGDAENFHSWCDGVICAMSALPTGTLEPFFQEMGLIDHDNFFVYYVLDNLYFYLVPDGSYQSNLSNWNSSDVYSTRQASSPAVTFPEMIELYHQFIGDIMLECCEQFPPYIYILTPYLSDIYFGS